MRFKRLVIAAAAAGAAFGIASAVQASIPDTDGTVHACYASNNLKGYPPGTLRAIDTAKINGFCGANETPVDLASTAYVQNFVQNFQNTTMLIGPASSIAANSDGGVSATCPAGYIATGGSAVINQGGALFDVNTLDGWNVGLFNNAAPSDTWSMEVHNTTAGSVPVAVQVTCTLSQALGLAPTKQGPAKIGR